MKKTKVTTVVSLLTSALLLTAMSGCQSDGTEMSDIANLAASTETPDAETPSSPLLPAPHASEKPEAVTPPVSSGFTKCVSDDPGKMCIGVKVVSYKNSQGTPTLSLAETVRVFAKVNEVWKTCNIAFQVEEYKAIYPSAHGLAYGSESEKQTTSIRREFSDHETILVAVTGPWSGPTIAWTEMPGYAPYGVVVEDSYGENAFTVGHEIGHQMGLYHIENTSNLMNPFIGSNTQGLTSAQCKTARYINNKFWSNMMRR